MRWTRWCAGGLCAVFLVALPACGTSGKATVDPRARPAWIDDPAEGVSASAGFHVLGRQAQEELAMTRARDEFAKRFGVLISSEQNIEQVSDGNRLSTLAAKQIREEVRDREVKATVKSKWQDPANGTLWIWLVPAK